MSHTYVQNVIHVAFSTKHRSKSISKEFQPRLWAYVAGICKNHGIFVHAVGGTDDHIHLLIQIPAPLSVAKAVLAIKSNSSRWANEQGNKFAVSYTHLDVYKRQVLPSIKMSPDASAYLNPPSKNSGGI